MKRPAQKRAIVVTALVLCSLSPALASSHYEMAYHDTIRPNGHPRSKAISDAALNACYSQTGLSRDAADTPAFKDCMKDRGYQWVSTKLVQNRPSKQTTSDGSFIDPDNGMLCQNTGFAEVCGPPPGTVHYTNKHGLNCTRTGIMSVCTSF